VPLETASPPVLGKEISMSLSRSIPSIVLLAVPVLTVSCGEAPSTDSEADTVTRLRAATTTSLYDTGLWDLLEPRFEEETGYELDVVGAGTGRALEWGRNGDVDVIIVHARTREDEFVADGWGVERIPFAYNHFVIIGPPDDPAGLAGMLPESAFRSITERGTATFVSRGDDSGTHGREQAIWTAAEQDYSKVRVSGEWYVEAGCGMGPALAMADEMGAYTLSDLGTFAACRGDLELEPLVTGGEQLLNVYSVIVVSATPVPGPAQQLADFLVSERIQELIGSFGMEEYGFPLFIPCAGNDPEAE
jgi:tungstate transport system substrate-binding protein